MKPRIVLLLWLSILLVGFADSALPKKLPSSDAGSSSQPAAAKSRYLVARPGGMQEAKARLTKYLDWLLTSPHGRQEAAQKQNHGTLYDVQVMRLALMVGRPELAREIAAASGQTDEAKPPHRHLVLR